MMNAGIIPFILFQDYNLLPARPLQPKIRARMKRIIKMKKRIRATPAAATAMPVNPNNAAISETTKKTSAQYSI
jgi:hypothetical protein